MQDASRNDALVPDFVHQGKTHNSCSTQRNKKEATEKQNTQVRGETKGSTLAQEGAKAVRSYKTRKKMR